jgi:hypothetical protein
MHRAMKCGQGFQILCNVFYRKVCFDTLCLTIGGKLQLLIHAHMEVNLEYHLTWHG